MKRLLFFGALLACAGWAAAHDFWIEPSSYTPKPGESVGVRFKVGERWAGEPVARPAGGFRQFTLDDGRARRAINGRAGADPAGLLRIATGGAGVQIVVYHGDPIPIELEAQKFTGYLKEEGLEAVIEQRAARGETGKIGREVYSRNAKSLLRVRDASGAAGASDSGDGGDRGDRVIGLPLELIAERNPYQLRDGDDLPVQLLHQGRPLQGALVVAVSRARPAEARSARSDAQGRVRLRLDANGPWLVKAVHMQPAADPALADWESLWASLTFELAPR